jgi:DnaJ-class molecular chaperone
MADNGTTDAPERERTVPCPPCRGTGRIVSRLGGSASTVTCPWCDGTGVLIPGHDAQGRRKGSQPGGDDGPAAA